MKNYIKITLFLMISVFTLSSCKVDDQELIDVTAPAEITNLVATPEDSNVTLKWVKPTNIDFTQVQITYSPENNQEQPILLSSDFSSKEFSGLTNGVEYTFTVKTVDYMENISVGVSVKASPIEPIVLPPAEMTDVRDGRKYKTVKIGDQVWMAENLKYLPQGASLSASDVGSNTSDFTKHYYVYGLDNGGNMSDVTNNAVAKGNFDTYGVLYNWYAAIGIPSAVTDTASLEAFLADNSIIQGIAPEGWHIPTDDDFKILEATLGTTPETADMTGYRDDNAEAAKLRSQEGWLEGGIGLDEVGYNLLPSGRWKTDKTQFLTEYAYLWTSSFSHYAIKTDESGNEYNETRAWLRYVKYNINGVGRAAWEHFNGYAIRCVKDTAVD